jgi:hypothetical protein
MIETSSFCENLLNRKGSTDGADLHDFCVVAKPDLNG